MTKRIGIIIPALLVFLFCSMTAVSAETIPPYGEGQTGRPDGERFEEVILIEGMEETVRYEHARNDTLGIELDYDWELFDRQSEADRERFVSRYDRPEAPENYLEVAYSAEDADTVLAAVSAELSEAYDIMIEPVTLDGAGSGMRIDASRAKGGGTPDLLQTVYIIPAPGGCLTAAAHYSFESAEGFGVRFGHILNTLVIIGGRAE